MSAPVPADIAAVAAVMDEIDQCRNPKPCHLCRQRMQSILDMGAAAERERIYDQLGRDHYVIFTQDRWTVEHSVECRLSGRMPECEHHAAVARIADEFDPAMAGRWRISGIDSDGLPDLERDPAPAAPAGQAGDGATASDATQATPDVPHPTKPAVMELWHQAGGGTEHYDRERFRDLMHQHGHLLRPGDNGYEQGARELPCGWPGEHSQPAASPDPARKDRS